MANFLKIIDTPDLEVIIDTDKVDLLRKTPTYNVIYIGGTEFQISDDAYEKIKERIFHPFGTPHKT